MTAHDLGRVAVFLVKGPDALRYLNGQITQDARKVVNTQDSLPACLLDAKGRVQFRVWIAGDGEGNLLVHGSADRADEVEARLGKYLIADDAEIIPLGEHRLLHFPGGETPEGSICRRATRFGRPGTDVLLPSGGTLPDGVAYLTNEETEDTRIRHLVPGEAEFAEPVFPQEAGLEASDISFHKGCYIGQEVISRIKRAGKVNKQLALIELADGTEAPGRVTSISPLSRDGTRAALCYLRRATGQS